MEQTKRFLLVIGLGMLLFMVSALSSCSPGAGDETREPSQDMGSGQESEEKEKVRELPVVYSRAKIAKNRVIRPHWLEVKMIPETQVPVEEGYFEAIEEVVGMLATGDIPKGIGILEKMVTTANIDRLGKVVSKGKVAIAVPTDAITAMPFVAPNDRVDVIGTLILEDSVTGKTRAQTSYLAENVRVLAVHMTFDPGPYAKRSQRGGKGASQEQEQSIRNPYNGRSEIRSVTLEVDSALAQKLALATVMSKDIRLTTHSATGKQSRERDISIDDRWLEASAKGEEARDGDGDGGEKKKDRYEEFFVYKGSGRRDRRVWSVKQLNEPYDEDADAPLFQDGKATGVKADTEPVDSRPSSPEDVLLEPLEEVDDLDVELPSLAPEIELPESPDSL